MSISHDGDARKKGETSKGVKMHNFLINFITKIFPSSLQLSRSMTHYEEKIIITKPRKSFPI